MARTTEQIEADLQATYRGINPTVDAVKGPIFDQVIRPTATVANELEVRQDRTDRLVSADFAAVATADELERMAATVGAGTPQGETAKGTVFLGSRSRPRSNTVITIKQGTLVGDDSLSYIFVTTEEAVIDGRYADNYHNATKRTYEVEVPVEAVAVGTGYNLPPYRVRRPVNTISGIDFVENREATADGLDPGGSETVTQNAQTKLTGQELASPGGITAEIVKGFPDALSVAVISSADYLLFRRALDKPGLDYYYAGERLTADTYEYVAQGGELTLPFPHNPVRSITSVTVSGADVAYTWVQDDDPATAGSTEDTSYIQFAGALVLGANVQIKYVYDGLAEAIEEDFGGEGSGFFKTSIVIRRSVRMAPVIRVRGVADTGFNAFDLKESLLSATIAFLQDNTFGGTYNPRDYREALGAAVIGLRATPTVDLFQLQERGLVDVEPIELRANETILVDTTLVEILVS